MAHPLQPLYTDKNGIVRFRGNKAVKFLLDNSGYDLNELARIDFSDEDREQFAQLIGYSLSGFGDLSYVSDEVYEKAASQEAPPDISETPGGGGGQARAVTSKLAAINPKAERAKARRSTVSLDVHLTVQGLLVLATKRPEMNWSNMDNKDLRILYRLSGPARPRISRRAGALILFGVAVIGFALLWYIW